jgi:hypothetical protein
MSLYFEAEETYPQYEVHRGTCGTLYLVEPMSCAVKGCSWWRVEFQDGRAFDECCYLRVRLFEFYGLVVSLASFELKSQDVGIIVRFMVYVIVDGLRKHLKDDVGWNTLYSIVISSMVYAVTSYTLF